VGGGGVDLREVVEATGVTLRQAQELARAMAPDVELDRLVARFSGDPAEYAALAPPAVAAPGETELRAMRAILERVPKPLPELDHVPARADTVLRRAAWLAEHVALERARVLLLGDHDCTSLAFGVLGLRCAELVVVDVDQRVLDFVGGHDVRSLFADLRVGLPPACEGRFDLVLTDPPYSADGVGLFAARAVTALAPAGRIVVAYGFPHGSPALGLKVQSELVELGLVTEEVVRGFNRYHGAHAVGARADLYVLRPTARAFKVARRRAAGYSSHLYTRGRQAAEAGESERPPDGLPAPTHTLVELLAAPPDGPVVVTLAPDHLHSLYQAVVAVAGRQAVLIADNHTEGLRSAAEQRTLADVVRPVLEVTRIERSFRGSRLTVVRLSPVEADHVLARIWCRPHAPLRALWLEEAHAEPPFASGDARLIDLPASTVVALQSALVPG